MDDLTFAEAEKQGAALADAAAASPIRQVRYELERRAREWVTAARDVAETSGEGTIELAGAVTPGMLVLWKQENWSSDWSPVIRTMTNGGQFSVHVDDGTRGGAYLNRFGPSSPMVVQR